jgi:hypothetical protein
MIPFSGFLGRESVPVGPIFGPSQSSFGAMARLACKTTLLLDDAAGVKQQTRSRKMKLVSNYGNNWKHINVQVAALACGVALAAAAIVGGSEVLRDRDDNGAVSPVRVAQPAGRAIDPTDLGSVGIERTLAQLAAETAGRVFVEQGQGIGQAGESVNSTEALRSEASAYQTALESMLVDPTDFASSFADYRAPQQFGTQADAVYAAESWLAATSQGPMFGTMVDAVYVMETAEYLQ